MLHFVTLSDLPRIGHNRNTPTWFSVQFFSCLAGIVGVTLLYLISGPKEQRSHDSAQEFCGPQDEKAKTLRKLSLHKQKTNSQFICDMMSRGLMELREGWIRSGFGLSSLLRRFKTMKTQRDGNYKKNLKGILHLILILEERFVLVQDLIKFEWIL